MVLLDTKEQVIAGAVGSLITAIVISLAVYLFRKVPSKIA